MTETLIELRLLRTMLTEAANAPMQQAANTLHQARLRLGQLIHDYESQEYKGPY